MGSGMGVLAKVIGGAIMFLGGAFAFIALVRVFEDMEFIREIVFKFEALGIYSLWFIAIILFAVGYYVFNAD